MIRKRTRQARTVEVSDRCLDSTEVSGTLDRAGLCGVYDTPNHPAEDPFGYIAEEIHGITARELDTAPPFPGVAEALFGVLDGCVLAGHGVAFDVEMILGEYARAGLPAPGFAGLVCTMAIAGAR